MVAKIGDLGMAQEVPAGMTKTATELGGTMPYLDPHFFTSLRYEYSSDVYSFGLIMAQVVTGKDNV